MVAGIAPAHDRKAVGPAPAVDDRLRQRLFRYLSTRTPDAEDVLQDVVLRLLRADLSQVICIDAYAMRTAQMVLADRARKARARCAGLHCEIPYDLPSPEESVEACVVRCQLARVAVSTLHPAAQMIVRMYFWDGLNEREISDAIGRPRAYVKTTKFRAIRKMRAKLAVMA